MELGKQISSIQAIILRTLLVDGRKSVSEIADKTGIAEELVQQNYSEMKKNGIIKGATIHFNYKGFGYFAVAFITVTVDPKQADEMIKTVRQMHDIYAVFKTGVPGNIRVVATLKRLKQLDEIKDALKQKFSISSIKTVIWTDVKEMHGNLLLAPDNPQLKEKEVITEELSGKRSRAKVKIDEVDLKIVEALSNDGRAAFAKIGHEIGVSCNTVKKRYEKLVRNRLIKVTIQINPSKIGYNALAIFFVTFTLHIDSSTIVGKISQIPDVISIMKTSGDCDLQVYVMIRDINQLLNVQDQFTKIEGIAKTEMDISRVLEKWPTPRQYISTF
jgi:Lrp/AsnC family transcriptional regulator, regulator for asnA, asnC and gidA